MERTSAPPKPSAPAALPAARAGAPSRLSAAHADTLSRLLLLVPVAALLLGGWLLRWTNEDGFIYYRVVENLVHGHGPVYNVGERVEAYTSPVWLALVSAVRLVTGLPVEWIAAVLALACAGIGLWAVGTAALRRAERSPAGGAGLALPLGALVVVALFPFWEYATSGLETSLVLAWLGLSYLWLVGAAYEPLGRRRIGALAAWIGIGPLVRPDLLPFAAGFLVLLVLLGPRPRLRRGLALAAIALAFPVAYQVFRMGYFAALVPNTALAKEAGASYWGRGWEYLLDFLSTYFLYLPVAVLLAWSVLTVRGDLRSGRRRDALLVATPVVCGLLHALYVVRLGGDYMHARMLLPSLFGLVMPVAVVRARPRHAAVLTALVLPWAIVAAAALRPDAAPPRDRSKLQVYDKRRAYPAGQRVLTAEDYERTAPARALTGLALERAARRRRSIVIDYGDRVVPGRRGAGAGPLELYLAPVPYPGLRPRPDLGGDLVAWLGGIGRTGFVAGPDVYVADLHGLADPLAARLRLRKKRGSKPGHEKHMPRAWVIARFTDPAALRREAPYLTSEVLAARAALRCGDLRRVLAAVDDPLTPQRFVRNLGVAVSTAGFRIPRDPVKAQRKLCG